MVDVFAKAQLIMLNYTYRHPILLGGVTEEQ